ncbi:MAG: RidA family protein [bacterium]|nr:RidA family protein [bacterium]
MLKEVKTNKAPLAVGPYSQAVVAGDFVFCSGQIGLDPKTNEFVSGGTLKQTQQVLANLGNVLKASGCDFKDVVRADVFLQDMDDFAAVNEVYSTFFASGPKPARQTVEVSRLPKGAHVEISAVAYKAEK